MIRNRFRRIGGENDETAIRFLFKNEEIKRICKTKPASVFCEIQHQKFVGHVARIENDAPQKQWLFAKTGKKPDRPVDTTEVLGNDWNVEPEQLRKVVEKGVIIPKIFPSAPPPENREKLEKALKF